MAPLTTRLVALPLAGRLVKFAPLIAGSVPVIFAAGKLVKFVPDIAGNVPVKFAAGNEVKFAPEPEKVVAVTIPLNRAPPSSYIVEPVPIGVSAPRTFTPATSTPALCKLEEPVLKLDDVVTPVMIVSPPISKAEVGIVDPIPTLPAAFCVTPPVPD